MNGADAKIFAGCIGENSSHVRRLICENLEWFGVRLNDENNENFINMREGIISTENSRPDIYVIPTNEELLIARDTVRLI